jgi:hypothetical protein
MLTMDKVQKWQSAVDRALASDLPHRLVRRGAIVIVPSKSKDGAVYHVQLVGGKVGVCDCPAGLHRRPCAHKAAVIIRLLERSIGARIAAMETEGIARFDEHLYGASPILPVEQPHQEATPRDYRDEYLA